jgi:hypothetical protein
MKNLKKNWFTYVLLIYSLVTVVDYLLYRFWDIGTNADDFRNISMWICLLTIWIFWSQENKTPSSESPSEPPDSTPPAEEAAADPADAP